MTPKLKEYLEKLSAQSTVLENMDNNDCIHDWAGGNIDDAYDMGIEDGQTLLARELLKNFGD